MVNYNSAVNIHIENVEHPIHILGVQPQALIACFWAFLVTLAIFPLFAPFGALLIAFCSRVLFFKEQSGRPLTFNHFILNTIKKFPNLKSILPSTNGLILFDGVYYGS